jgi:quercetin dioxygenase-like cupin family protein
MVPDRHMDPYFAEFVPLPAQTEPKSHMHPGYEFLYLLAGQLALQHSGQETVLEPGDAVYFDSATPHSYRCTGTKPAEAIIVALHQAPAAQQPRLGTPAAVPRPVPLPAAGAPVKHIAP